MFCFVVVVVVVVAVVVDSKNGMDPPCMGASYCVSGRGGRVGGAQQRSKKGRMRPGQTRPVGRAGRWGTGSRDKKRDKD